MQSTDIKDIAAAFAKAQGVMSNAQVNRENPHFKSKYAGLDAIIDAVREPLSSNGLSFYQAVHNNQDINDLPLPGAVLITTLMHTSGQWISSHYPLAMTGTPQQVGSALTYARRYSLMALVGIAASEDNADDDGNRVPNNGKPAPVPEQPNHIVPAEEVEAPIDPQTGEVSPHTIVAENTRVFAQKFLAALKHTKDEMEVDEWVQANMEKLEFIQIKAVAMYRNLQAAIEKRTLSHRALT